MSKWLLSPAHIWDRDMPAYEARILSGVPKKKKKEKKIRKIVRELQQDVPLEDYEVLEYVGHNKKCPHCGFKLGDESVFVLRVRTVDGPQNKTVYICHDCRNISR